MRCNSIRVDCDKSMNYGYFYLHFHWNKTELLACLRLYNQPINISDAILFNWIAKNGSQEEKKTTMRKNDRQTIVFKMDRRFIWCTMIKTKMAFCLKFCLQLTKAKRNNYFDFQITKNHPNRIITAAAYTKPFHVFNQLNDEKKLTPINCDVPTLLIAQSLNIFSSRENRRNDGRSDWIWMWLVEKSTKYKKTIC